MGILGALAAAVEEPPATGERIRDVEVARLAPHPDNVREDMGDVSGLGASIAERGVLQPLVVVSRAAFHTARPDVELAPDTGWVILAGHRRRAGALAAGVATVPVVVRDALAGDDDAVISMLVENLQREDLSPIEQARAFGRLRGRAWSERQIATSTGVSPGQVHKRLALLRLPAALVAALGCGDLTVADALRLLDLPDDQLIPAWTQAGKESWRGVRGVVEARLAALRAAEQAEQLRGAFTAAGVALIEDPEQTFGSDWWHHRLLGTFTVPGVAAPDSGTDTAAATGAAALPAGALAHVATYGGNVRVQYFTREPSARPDPTGAGGAPGASGGSTPPVDDEWRRRREEDRRRAEDARAAADARAGACTRLVTGQLDPELAVDILADALLVDHTVEPYETAGLAAAWCGFDLAALAEADDVDDPVTAWLDTQAAAGRLPARRAAVAVALAEAENTLGFGAMSDRPWTARERRHVRRLAAHAGYELTADDQRRLDTHEGASAGSTPHPEGTPR